jgi:hypothetical protein
MEVTMNSVTNPMTSHIGLGMSGPARWEWTHEIAACDEDQWEVCDEEGQTRTVALPRERRVSMTFRRLVDV